MRPIVINIVQLAKGQLQAHSEGQNLALAAGDFLFLPRGAAASLRCLPERPASGFLIKGRLPTTASHPSTNGDNA